MTEEWLFSDPPDVAVYTSEEIMNKSEWIHYVGHDEGDGAWQFHSKNGPGSTDQAKVVALRSIVKLDPSTISLADMPLGWCAVRESPTAEWIRSKQNESVRY